MMNAKDNLLPFEKTQIADFPCRFFLCEIAKAETRFSRDVSYYLTESEIDVWKNIRDNNYRRAWIAGRLMTKAVYESLKQNSPDLVSHDSISFLSYEIISRNAANRGIRPYLLENGTRTSATLTITHSESMVGVGVAFSEHHQIGMDITPFDSVSPKVVKTFFTDEEKNLIVQFPNDHWAERIWCAKESAYKSLNHGEPFVPTRFNILSYENQRLNYQYSFENEIQQISINVGLVGKMVYAIC
jgi:phosphopantetheinyl transferase (holo-ACP synthase)